MHGANYAITNQFISGKHTDNLIEYLSLQREFSDFKACYKNQEVTDMNWAHLAYSFLINRGCGEKVPQKHSQIQPF